jgi:hypothetical protein
MKTTWTIGKEKSCDICIEQPQISRQHAKLTSIDGYQFILEDLESTNGTFVDKMRVRRSVITKENDIKLANIKFDISPYLDIKPIKKLHDAEIPAAFKELKSVYDEYEQNVNRLQRGQTIRRGVIQASLAWIPFVGSPAGILLNTYLTKNEKIAALNKQFSLTYLCPKCNNHLGNKSWENLELVGKCLYCKVEWLKE